MNDSNPADGNGTPEGGESREPMPIWFFVGLILTAYGIIIVCSAVLVDIPDRVKQVTAVAPGIWWGTVILAGGIAFLAAGLKGRRP
ncbi:MAG: hypothetical protein GXP54_00015 [Deltaproteobacteria bacterium]|nr:hypothetical protein [Deltaproteobacteria bacterium]